MSSIYRTVLYTFIRNLTKTNDRKHSFKTIVLQFESQILEGLYDSKST